MSSRIVLGWAVLGWLLMVGAAGTAAGQVRLKRAGDMPIMEETSFPTDFRTLFECLERVARDEGLTIRVSGTGSSWEATGLGGGFNEPVMVVMDGRKFPILGNRALAHLGRPQFGGNPNNVQVRKIALDPDTGELTSPEGVDIRGLRITRLQLHLTLTRAGGGESCQVNLAREFSDKQVKVSISKGQRGGQEFSRDLRASLESKLRLAWKLSEARKKARRAEPHEKRASDPEANEPTPARREKPKSLGSPG